MAMLLAYDGGPMFSVAQGPIHLNFASGSMVWILVAEGG